MKCPKCGYAIRPMDHRFAPPTECPACGIVYAKFGGTDATPQADAQPATGSILNKPSPVHAESLRNARERVEKRLHRKPAGRIVDIQRYQTLELARQLADEGVRQRREEWKRRQETAQAELSQPAALEAPVFSDDTPEAQRIGAGPAAQTQPVDLTDPPAPDTRAAAESVPAAKADSTERRFKTDDPPSSRMISETERCASPPPIIEPEEMNPDRAHAQQRPSINGRNVNLLPVIAWLILCAGLVGAVLSWTTMSSVHADTADVFSSTGKGFPVALLLGFAYLATGVLGFAFFWVTSTISYQIADIRHLLLIRTAPPKGGHSGE